jgi:hypothetical protein
MIAFEAGGDPDVAGKRSVRPVSGHTPQTGTIGQNIFRLCRLRIYREKLLTAILKNEWMSALKIANERIAKNDIGGFMAGSVSFYQQAALYSGKHVGPV